MTAAGEGGRLSSDDGDAETAEDTDRPGFHYSSHHPQPLGVNSMTNVALAGILAVHNLRGPVEAIFICHLELFVVVQPWK